MEKIKFIVVLTACLFFTFACTNKAETKESNVTTSNVHEIPPAILVPVSEAAGNIQNYINMCDSLLQDHVPVLAFTTRAADLLGAMGLSDTLEKHCNYNHVRAYIGLDAQKKFKLYFVSVSGATLSANYGGEDVAVPGTPPSLEPNVLDLNTPCPQVCATNNIFSITPTP